MECVRLSSYTYRDFVATRITLYEFSVLFGLDRESQGKFSWKTTLPS